MNAVVRDNTALTPGSREAWEGRNLVNTCSNGASEESIGIYAKSRCQWSGRSMDLELELQRFEAVGALRTATVAKAPKELGGLPKQK